MAVEKSIEIGGQVLRMRASALIPRLYRAKFGRDMIRDLNRLQADIKDVEADETNEKVLSCFDLEVFENLAWLLAKHADPDVPSDPDDWLESLPGVMNIYEFLPVIMELMQLNNLQTSVPRKK